MKHKNSSKNFLHNHPYTEHKYGLDATHVIVDRKEWELVKRFPEMLEALRELSELHPDGNPSELIKKAKELIN